MIRSIYFLMVFVAGTLSGGAVSYVFIAPPPTAPKPQSELLHAVASVPEPLQADAGVEALLPIPSAIETRATEAETQGTATAGQIAAARTLATALRNELQFERIGGEVCFNYQHKPVITDRCRQLLNVQTGRTPVDTALLSGPDGEVIETIHRAAREAVTKARSAALASFKIAG